MHHMLQNITYLYDRKLGASDGEIGHVKDIYFDDKTWSIRYLVADTGSWLSERLVLLAPAAFGLFAFGEGDTENHVLRVNLTRKQIEDSPPIESHRPVSRKFEEDYHRYYGWPSYWQDSASWSGASLPAFAPPMAEGFEPRPAPAKSEDLHLRSTRAMTGYRVLATDGPVGTIRSFVAHQRSWKLREIVVDAGHWYSGKDILVLPENVIRIQAQDSTIALDLTREDIQGTRRNDVAQAGAGRM
ncbi:MAG: PRC-barrel domain-containing protein [Opitutaceae bacterium]